MAGGGGAFQKDQSIKSRDYLARIIDTLASVQYQTKSYKTLQATSRSPAVFLYNWTHFLQGIFFLPSFQTG